MTGVQTCALPIFVVKNIMPRETDHDRVTMCDTLILGEVARRIPCDTAQYMVFQMQQSVKSTTTGLPFPHYVRPILVVVVVVVVAAVVVAAVVVAVVVVAVAIFACIAPMPCVACYLNFSSGVI